MAYTTINKPSDYFNTKLYTGTGASNSVTGIGFQPDWVWFKQRSGATWHNLYDVLRGTTLALASNDTGGDDTRAQGLTAFNSDGFTIGTDSNVNGSTNTYASWNWKANGAGVSNYSGTITSTVSANTTAGFSIVSYTGTGANATVGHGLGVTPKMIIVKGRSYVDNWAVYHSSLGNGKKVKLNTTGAEITSSTVWNNTSPTSSVFSLGTDTEVNQSTSTYISYCFAEIKGYSKFGSYTGNGSADGTFIYTGFKPAFFLNKRTDTTSSVWFMFDNKRNTFNVVNADLYANTNDSESATNRIDFLSNGFKIRNTSTGLNASGGTYIYMAFAEQPLVGTNNIPATAR